MDIRPQTRWMPIHPNYVAGLAAITTPFILYPALEWQKKLNWRVGGILRICPYGVGYCLLCPCYDNLARSGYGDWERGGGMAVMADCQLRRNQASDPDVMRFSHLLCLFFYRGIIAFLYIGPANSGSMFSGNYYYGNGSRLELLSRSLYLLWDYPITGGGLGAFPGLYSQYLLNIPFFNVPNSHNMFLDAAIELGLLGGLSFVLMYLASIWLVSRSLAQENTNTTRVFNWILLFSLIVAVVHGMVEDYLFNGNGTILSLFFVALSVLVTQKENLGKPIISKFYRRIAGLWLVVLVLLLFLFSKNIMSTWYANLGSVLMSQVELDGFPDKGWAGSDSLSKMDDAEIALHASLHFAPDNRTANQRLGMIAMLRQDFELASEYLETAHEVAPGHRGIVKSLGYCYVWLGDFEKASLFLSRIPEAQEELDVYIWWWGTQGRGDLSDNAALALQTLKTRSINPKIDW